MLLCQLKVVEELNRLNEKLDNLNIFVETDRFKSLDKAEQDRLFQQQIMLQQYATILETKISAFNKL